MELERLSAKQKRLKDWLNFLEHEVRSESLRIVFGDALKHFRNLLAKCWEAGEITTADMEHLEDLERQLEQLMEESRLSDRC